MHMHTSEQYFKFHGVEIIMDAIFLTLTLKILQMQNMICCTINFFWYFCICTQYIVHAHFNKQILNKH